MPSRTSFNRRRLLRLAPALAWTLGRWPGALAAGDVATKEIRFAVFNDLHVRERACADWLGGVVDKLKADEKIDFVVLAGDLSHLGRPEPHAWVRDAFGALGVPVRAVLGNHDWANDTDRKSYEAAFPRQVNYTFTEAGWQFLGLDTSHGQRARVAVQPTTLRWLDDNLGKLDAKKPLVVFTHFPLGPKVPNRLTNADAVLGRFARYNLRAIFAGHHHGFTERKSGEAVLTTNRCCSRLAKNHDGSKEKGYFVCQGKDGRITRRFVEVKVG